MTYLAEKIHLKVQANTRFVQSRPSENIVQSVRNYGIIQNLFQRMVLPWLIFIHAGNFTDSSFHRIQRTTTKQPGCSNFQRVIEKTLFTVFSASSEPNP